MKTLITTLLAMTFSFTFYGQQVTATAGTEYKNAEGSITFTIGEPVISTLQAGNNLLTQGVHQNNIQVAITAVYDPVFSSIKVFPNPASDKLIINLENTHWHGNNFRLHNFNGQQIRAGNIRGMEEEIDLTSFVAGTYILTILRNEKTMITFTIIKQ